MHPFYPHQTFQKLLN